MSDPIDAYLTFLAARTGTPRPTAPASIRAARADLAGFARWWQDQRGMPFELALILDTDVLDWHDARYAGGEGVKATTLNRARSSLLGFFAWAQSERLISHNPAAALPQLEKGEIAPRSTPPEAVDWLVRAASAQADPTTQLRDLALLTVLSDLGLRSQEAADVQLRDLDLDGAMLLVRKGKRAKTRRVPLPEIAVRRLRDYLRVRCPVGSPAPGHTDEQAPLLMARQAAKTGQPWVPGLQPVSMRKLLLQLGQDAAARVREQAAKEPSTRRSAALLSLAEQLEQVSPHRLRHGLAYRMKQSHIPLEDIGRVLGHSNPQITTVIYGKAFEDDLRDSLDTASRYVGKQKQKRDA